MSTENITRKCFTFFRSQIAATFESISYKNLDKNWNEYIRLLCQKKLSNYEIELGCFCEWLINILNHQNLNFSNEKCLTESNYSETDWRILNTAVQKLDGVIYEWYKHVFLIYSHFMKISRCGNINYKNNKNIFLMNSAGIFFLNHRHGNF